MPSWFGWRGEPTPAGAEPGGLGYSSSGASRSLRRTAIPGTGQDSNGRRKKDAGAPQAVTGFR